MASTYTQGHDASTLASHQSRTAEAQADYLLPHIQPSSRILDVGCGPGNITCDFARYAPEGRVTGVDLSEKVLEHARAEAEKRGVGNVSFQIASAHSLPFEDESFDVVHCHALLIHVPDPAAAVREMWRVCKKGGYLGCREGDWATLVVYPPYPLIAKWTEVSTQLMRNQGAEPNAGRHLAEWAMSAGFTLDNIQVTSNTLQYFGKTAQWWGSLNAERIQGEHGQRVVSTGLLSREELDQVYSAYLDWSNSEAPLWSMMHMRLLCQK